MPNEIGLEELRTLLDQSDTTLVEVLPAAEYSDEHLPGAINIPLKSLDENAVKQLDADRPTVVYCYDYQ